MSFYFMYDAKQCGTHNALLKIGYMSTTNIKHIISRYATGCGYNIIVHQFLDSEPRVMESKFKEFFKNHHIQLEFYDATRYHEYIHWCINYTKSSPIVGYGELRCVSNVETKSVGTQCDVPPTVVPPPPPVASPPPAPQPQFTEQQQAFISDLQSILKCTHCTKVMTKLNICKYANPFLLYRESVTTEKFANKILQTFHQAYNRQ